MSEGGLREGRVRGREGREGSREGGEVRGVYHVSEYRGLV